LRFRRAREIIDRTLRELGCEYSSHELRAVKHWLIDLERELKKIVSDTNE